MSQVRILSPRPVKQGILRSGQVYQAAPNRLGAPAMLQTAGKGPNMSRFSDRIGVTAPPRLAIGEMSEELRTALWNVLESSLFTEAYDGDMGWRNRIVQLYVFLHWRLDELTWNLHSERQTLAQWWVRDELEWYEIYNVVDFIAPRFGAAEADRADFVATLNQALEIEGSPYRFVGETLTTVSGAH